MCEAAHRLLASTLIAGSNKRRRRRKKKTHHFHHHPHFYCWQQDWWLLPCNPDREWSRGLCADEVCLFWQTEEFGPKFSSIQADPNESISPLCCDFWSWNTADKGLTCPNVHETDWILWILSHAMWPLLHFDQFNIGHKLKLWTRPNLRKWLSSDGLI